MEDKISVNAENGLSLSSPALSSRAQGDVVVVDTPPGSTPAAAVSAAITTQARTACQSMGWEGGDTGTAATIGGGNCAVSGNDFFGGLGLPGTEDNCVRPGERGNGERSVNSTEEDMYVIRGCAQTDDVVSGFGSAEKAKQSEKSEISEKSENAKKWKTSEMTENPKKWKIWEKADNSKKSNSSKRRNTLGKSMKTDNGALTTMEDEHDDADSAAYNDTSCGEIQEKLSKGLLVAQEVDLSGGDGEPGGESGHMTFRDSDGAQNDDNIMEVCEI